MIRPGALVLADGSVFEGELFGAEPDERRRRRARSCSTPSSSGYQEVITDPSYAGQIITFTTPHIGNYGIERPPTTSRARPFCRGVIVREIARRHSNWRASASLDDRLRPRRHQRDRRDRHPPADPAAARHRRDAGCVRLGGRSRRCAQPPRAEPGTDGIDLVAQVTTPQRYIDRRRAAPRRRDRLRDQADDPALPRRDRHRRRGAGVDDRGRRSSRCARTACSSRTGPAIRPPCRYAVDTIRELLGEVPVFGICLGHQLLCRAIGGDDVQAAVRSPRREPPGPPRGDRPRRDHQPEPQLLRRPDEPSRQRRGHARQPQRPHQRGHATAATCPRSACSTTPRPGPVRTTAATCSRCSTS